MSILITALTLQLADVLISLAAFALGVEELNPLYLDSTGTVPISRILFIKGVAAVLIIFTYVKNPIALFCINYVIAAIVLYNLIMLVFITRHYLPGEYLCLNYMNYLQ